MPELYIPPPYLAVFEFASEVAAESLASPTNAFVCKYTVPAL